MIGLVEPVRERGCAEVGREIRVDDVSMLLSGPLDPAARLRLDREVTGWCRVVQRRAPATAHIDLSAVESFDTQAALFLTDVHRRLTEAGWRFRITPPDDVPARADFIRAATRGLLGWAGPGPLERRDVDGPESA